MAADNQGSIRYVVNNSGSVVDQINYGAFGNVAYESNPSVAHFSGYTGGHVDALTGLVNDYERWYDPIIAKWLSNDPIGFAAGDTDLSRYAMNSPTDRADPTGLFSNWWDDYKWILTHPGEQSTAYQVTFYSAAAIATVAAASAAALAVGTAIMGAEAAVAAEAAAASAEAGVAAAEAGAAIEAGAAAAAEAGAAAAQAAAAEGAATVAAVKAGMVQCAKTATLDGLIAWITEIQANLAAAQAGLAAAEGTGLAPVFAAMILAWQQELNYATAIWESMVTGL